VRAVEAIPEGEVLTIVIVELGMMNSVMRSTIHAIHVERNAVVNVHRPESNHENGSEVQQVVHREQENEDMVWRALKPSSDWVKRKCREWSRVLVAMVKLVQPIEPRVVKNAMNPVNKRVRENDKPHD